MSEYLSYELHNECNRLISRKSRKDIINEVMLLLDENSDINKNNFNKDNFNKNNFNNLENNKKKKKYIEDTVHEIMLIKIIKLLMCIK